MFEQLVEVALGWLRWLRFFYVVRSYERGVVLRLGKFHKEVAPGLHFMLPFMIDEVWTTSVVRETMKVGPQSLTTLDGISVVVSTMVTFEIDNPRIFLLEVSGAEHVVEDATYGAVGRAILSSTLKELVSGGLADKITAGVREQAGTYGVGIRSVQLTDFVACRSIRLFHPAGNHFDGVHRT